MHIQEYQEKPDYGRCVAIVASASLREMIKPGALAIISPVVIGESCVVKVGHLCWFLHIMVYEARRKFKLHGS